MIRDDIKAALVEAMKERNKDRVATLRLVQAAIKNRDIEARVEEKHDDDQMLTDVLAKMAKQRRESIDLFRQGGREELATAEEHELQIIESFLPRQLSDDEAEAEIRSIIAAEKATSARDMGRVMAALKARLGARLDMKKASLLVKKALS